MKRREFVRLSALGAVGLVRAGLPFEAVAQATRKVLIAGGGFGTGFIRYMASLTGAHRPKLLYLPTASADSQTGIIEWYKSCAPLEVYPLVQDSFIASSRQKQSWEDVLLSVDGIVASGGNTLNQQAIWKAQGIDIILRQAWDKGIVLGGASAGSICWFEEGTTDSRPKELTVVKGLGFLKGSHCPHYDREKDRRPLYQRLIASGELKPGYACDNDAGIYFENDSVKRIVATRADAKVYYVNAVDGRAVEKPLNVEMIEP
jgi:peptidase E